MSIKKQLSMPFWCVGNPVADPFGPPVMDRVSSIEVTDILCNARSEGLIDFTSAHDDDLVPWNPYEPMDDMDKDGEVYRTLKTIKAKMDTAGLKFKMISANLHANPVFRNGGLSNPDPRIRLLAAQKVMRALRIGNFLGAEYFTYWVARDGFETQFAVPWDKVYGYIRDGLNLARAYVEKEKLSIKYGTIEYKPNEPRGEMFLPTVGHSIAMIYQLDDPDFWGVNPEVLQHDQMTGLSSIGAVSFAASIGKLFFLHLGNQKPNQFDNDNPVMVGMDGLKELISILYVLGKMNWGGHIEFDNHILRTDAAPGDENKLSLREDFIRLVVDGYRSAEKKANELLGNEELSEMQDKLFNSDDEAAKLTQGNINGILKYSVDYNEVNQSALKIGWMDLAFDKAILGLS